MALTVASSARRKIMNEYAAIIKEAFIQGGLEVLRVLRPKDDELSQREAFAEFGKAFVLDAVAKGKVTVIRKGNAGNSKKLYSRAELTMVKGQRNVLRSIIRLETAKGSLKPQGVGGSTPPSPTVPRKK